MAKQGNKKVSTGKSVGIAAAVVVALALAVAVLNPGRGGDTPEAKNVRYLRERAAAEAAQGNLAPLRSVIKLFQHDHGRLPADLRELKDRGYIDQVPANVGYSPANGALFTRAQ